MESAGPGVWVGLGLSRAIRLLAVVMKPSPPAVPRSATAPVCLSPPSPRTHNQLDSSAIFTAINAIWLERKSIRCVHLCLRVQQSVLGWLEAAKPNAGDF